MRRLWQADGDRGAAAPGDLISSRECGYRAGCLDRHFHASIGCRLDARDQVRIVGAKRVCRAERTRQFQFRIELVDGNKVACAGCQRAEQRRQTDPAQTHDRR